MTEIEPATAAGRSAIRKQELAEKLVNVEQRVLRLVEQGLTAAGRTFSDGASSEHGMSPSALIQTAGAVEKLHKVAKDICGDAPLDAPQQINVNSIHASSDLMGAIARAYFEVEKGHLERAAQFIQEAEDASDTIEGELIED